MDKEQSSTPAVPACTQAASHHHKHRSRKAATMMGILAIVFWSTVFAFSRHLSEQVGTLTTGAWIFLLGGAAGCIYLGSTGRLGHVRGLPRRYLLVCGGLLVAYQICLYLALGTASTRRQVLDVTVINYLWPGLTLVMSLPILHCRARKTLWLGIVAALAGVYLAVSGGGLEAMIENVRANVCPYLLAFGAAVLWALYSNLTRLWVADALGNAVPIFVLASGLALMGLSLTFEGRATWSAMAIAELLYLATFPTLLAYSFWDSAMRRGHMPLVVSLSYLAPLASTAISCLVLDLSPAPSIWVACGLVVAGAAVCKWSVID